MKGIKFQRKGNKRYPENKDPVEVYCRIKPATSETICCKVTDYNKVLLFPPENIINIRNANNRECEYTFTKVFAPESQQKAIFQDIAKPLVKDLIDGKNGLVFAYGVTGSGKTYTMNGRGNDVGILLRCLDTIFNTLDKYQSDQYVFIPDRNNGFDILSPPEAAYERKKAMSASSLTKITFTPRKPLFLKEENFNNRSPDSTIIEDVPEDNSYCVFVSFIEIYNNYIYDLLEDVSLDQINMKTQISKTLREDSQHNVYVSGCTEVEVKSTDEAIEVLYKGLRKKRMASTVLNAESSRSHSVFNVRLVQAPLDHLGEYVLQDKSKICVSQLALVDLAGSERTNRTHNMGDRLREAGNINASLMVLRKCIEILRENQKDPTTAKIVPYRDSKLTHLFKNYFDGEGKVRMIVCMNPDASDFEENLHVIRFAELTQEVQVNRPTAYKVDTVGMQPGRRKANAIMQEASKATEKYDEERVICDGEVLSTPSVTPPPLFDLGPTLPKLQLIDVVDPTMLLSLENILSQKSDKMASFLALTLSNLDDLLKSNGMSGEDFEKLKKECNAYRAEIFNLDRSNLLLQNKVKELERINSSLSKKLTTYDKSHKTFENLLDENEMARKKLEKDMEKQMKAKEIEMENKLWAKNETLRQLKKIVEENACQQTADERLPLHAINGITGGDIKLLTNEKGDYGSALPKYPLIKTESDPSSDAKSANSNATAGSNFMSPPHNSTIKFLLSNTPKLISNLKDGNKPMKYPSTTPANSKRQLQHLVVPGQTSSTTPGHKFGHVASVAKMYDSKIANIGKTPLIHNRHRRRSRSVGDLKYLQHKSANQMNTRDVMQPKMKNVVTTDTLVKSSLAKADRYVLKTQEIDQGGDLKTELFTNCLIPNEDELITAGLLKKFRPRSSGDIFSTSGGGRAVIFDDVETHEHRALPGDSRKRLSSPVIGGQRENQSSAKYSRSNENSALLETNL